MGDANTKRSKPTLVNKELADSLEEFDQVSCAVEAAEKEVRALTHRCDNDLLELEVALAIAENSIALSLNPEYVASLDALCKASTRLAVLMDQVRLVTEHDAPQEAAGSIQPLPVGAEERGTAPVTECEPSSSFSSAVCAADA
jgi:hypothetical protein